MGTYTYDSAMFNVSVVFTGVFCIALAIVGVLGAVGFGPLPPGLAAVVALIALYQVWNTFVAIANPRQVIVSERSLSFLAFGREDRFPLDQIDELKVREFPGKLYVRVNGGGLLRGRYWVQTGRMDGGETLFRWFEDFEYQMHPNTVKATARRSSEVYSAHKDEVDRIVRRKKASLKRR